MNSFFDFRATAYINRKFHNTQPMATSPIVCTVPPEGWQCSRSAGHEGPCAATPTPTQALSDARLLEMEQQWLGFKAGVYADENGQEWFERNTGELIAEIRKGRAAMKLLEERRQYGADILNDMTLEASVAMKNLITTEGHWTDMRVIAAGMRRTANYALDLWEGEQGPLSEEDQLEVKKLLQEIGDTTWLIPWTKPTSSIDDLVNRFAGALRNKLHAALAKYGYQADGWLATDWQHECTTQLLEHVGKGDPRDVAAYCAFMWHHGWPTSPLPTTEC